MVSKVVTWLRRLVLLAGTAAVGLAVAAPSAPVQGEVRRINPGEGKITLKHEPIPELDLPAMTLVFRVQDTRLMANVKPGDKVTFTADRIDGQYTIISISR